MVNLILKDGFISDTEDILLWIESMNVDATACIVFREDGIINTQEPGIVAALIKLSDYSSDEEYNQEMNSMLESGSYDVLSEFIRGDECYYVGVNSIGPRITVDDFTTDGTQYC